MRLFGRLARTEVSVYLTGVSTAVIEGWRNATLDVDLRFEPELDEMVRGIPAIKEKLRINVEIAAPSDFVPELPGWRDRSIYIGREGKTTFFQYDAYSQALSKLERGHEKDLVDVEAMFERGSIVPKKLRRYPAISAEKFGETVRRWCDLHE